MESDRLGKEKTDFFSPNLYRDDIASLNYSDAAEIKEVDATSKSISTKNAQKDDIIVNKKKGIINNKNSLSKIKSDSSIIVNRKPK